MCERECGFQQSSGLLRGRFLRSVLLACAAVFAAAFAAGAGETLPLNAALLTRDLGDPREPGNVKLVLGLPRELARMTAGARPEDFRIYVHPVGLSREEGLAERYRAGGLYLWRHRNRIFLDARDVPAQEEEGLATVRVVFAPGGEPRAEGVAEGQLSYTSELVDVVLAVDVSRSMNYNDPGKRRVAAARAFIEMAERGGGIGRVGLVTFNHRATTNSPLLPLEEGDTLIRALDSVGADGLTNLDGPIRNSLEELAASRNPVIILLSDGKNEGSRYRDSHLLAAERGARIFTVGLSEEADHELLKEMADATDGVYFRAVTDADLPEIYARLAAELGKRRLLNAEPLASAYGEKTYSIDGTVTRLIALADGGAQVAAIGGGGMFTTGMSGVLTGRPEPGEWTFAWSGAAPGVSTLALFGDTRFFLDVFPPQMLGDRLGVGATLARGGEGLAGARVWVEALPGVLDSRLELFDDGLHGDGIADDGVYAASTVIPGAPERFDLTVRAAGRAWDKGGFVRQTAGLAIKVDAPPPESTVKLAGDVDFGVLFPGETGGADVTLELDAPEPKELRLDLSWGSGEDGDWPNFASDLSAEPGTNALRLEITIPETARPGSHTGELHVGDGDEIDARSRANVVVGTVDFASPGGIDLGNVPPGTFVSRTLEIPYRADKAAALSIYVDGSEDVAVAADLETLDGGRGTLPLEITVTAPMDKPEGGYAATVRLAAGPGVADIPLTWTVRRYAAAAPGFTVPEGLPAAPELPADSAPLQKSAELSENFWETGEIAAAPEPVDSPWEKTDRLLRRADGDGTDGAAVSGAPEGFAFPEAEEPPAGASFWSAWWLYILAALLLLLLLLLLLAYLLYRLGKSALARFLLVSALANILLMIVFILLLSVGDSPRAERAEPIEVNLIEEDEPVEVRLTAAEESLLSGTASGAAGSGGDAGAAAGETMLEQMRDAGSSGGQLAAEKDARLPENDAPETTLADALRPSAMPLRENENNQLRRSDSLPERNARQSEMPAPELAEMTEPSASRERSARDTDTAALEEPSEARLEITADAPSDSPVWSEGEKPVQTSVSDEGLLLAEAAGMETVRHDNSQRRLEPRAARRTAEDVSAVYPEPRVEIDDPARDADNISAANTGEDEGDIGAPEFRVADNIAGADDAGEKPGAVLPDGAYRLSDSLPEARARGLANTAAPQELSRPAGSRRSSRGTSGREESAAPGVSSSAPASSGASSSANGAGGGGGADDAAGMPGEQRFDDAPSGASGGADGVPNGTGSARTRSVAEGGGGSGASPNPFASGGSGDGKQDFAPANGSGGGAAEGQRRNNGNGRTGRSSSGAPSGSDSVPGGTGNSPASASGGGDGDSSGRGRRGGAGEGRFDDMNGTDGTAAAAGRRSGQISGVGSAELADASSGLGIVSYESGDDDWRRINRRGRPRNMAVAASAVDMDSLLLVVGDFARLPDSAAENLFSRLARRIGAGITLEPRRLSPGAENLSDALLALATPGQVASWSDAEVRGVAEYLKRGGHIWLDAENAGAERAAMERLAKAAGGEFAPLPEDHPLADGGDVDALVFGESLAAVATRRDWRSGWRFGDADDESDNGGTMRFFVRAVNYFLSGDADSGIVLAPGEADGGTLVQPYREIIPDTLSSAPAEEAATVWDDFSPATATAWRMPAWSDAGAISAISDGQGARALKLDLGAAEKGRAAVYRTLQPAQDFSAASAVTLDAYYDGGGEASLSMVFTVNEGGTWRDYETPQMRLETGWNTLRFALDAADFRALTPGGADDGGLPAARGRTGRAGFFLYRDGRSAAVTLFRNVRLVRR